MTIIEAYEHPDFTSGAKMARPVGWHGQAIVFANDGALYAFPDGSEELFYPNRGSVLADWELVDGKTVEAERRV